MQHPHGDLVAMIQAKRLEVATAAAQQMGDRPTRQLLAVGQGDTFNVSGILGDMEHTV